MGRNVEDHGGWQLNAVTQAPSEYVVRGPNYILKLIDCPGVADTRGVDQDVINTRLIAEFLARAGEFNAICIVLPASINRSTIEAKYFIEQIKSIIPKSAHNRIFICVSYSTTNNQNIKNFVESMELPVDNIFNFDNFALSRDGYFEDLNIDLNAQEEDMEDIFAEVPVQAEEGNGALVRKVRDSWVSSQRDFARLVRKAKELGKYSSREIAQISQLKNSITEKILFAHQKMNGIKDQQARLLVAQNNLAAATAEYNYALAHKTSSEAAASKAKLDKEQADALELYDTYTMNEEYDVGPHHLNTNCLNCGTTCHDGCQLEYKGGDCTDHLPGCYCMENNSCKFCPGKCSYTFHRHRYTNFRTLKKQREKAGVKQQQQAASSHYSRFSSMFTTSQQNLASKEQNRNTKTGEVRSINDVISFLENEKLALQDQIVRLYVELGEVSISPVNFYIGEYYDICIRREQDPAKKIKLNEDREFYMHLVNEYQRQNPPRA